MRTLDHWVDRLLKTPSTIECPKMQIIGFDHEPPIFEGSGRLIIRSSTEIQFLMNATPGDVGLALERIKNAQNNRHDGMQQFRLFATEYDGTEWNCGYTQIKVGEIHHDVWQISGCVETLITTVSNCWVAQEASVELVYDMAPGVPVAFNLVTQSMIGEKVISESIGKGNKIIEVAGVSIEFAHSVDGRGFWATANVTEEFPHPYAENWISEPLQILLGQLIYPRIVARNRGDGSSIIFLRPSPVKKAYNSISPMFDGDPEDCADKFWGMYRDILSVIVGERDDEGDPNFDPSKITRYYQEIIQSTYGSNWVICMTLASAIEGVVKLLLSPRERKSDADPEAVASLKKHIKAWKGDAKLKCRILQSLSFVREKGVVQSLKSFFPDDEEKRQQIDTWHSVRNSVMHGALVSPWIDQELEIKIIHLSSLFHSVSNLYIQRRISYLSIGDDVHVAGDLPAGVGVHVASNLHAGSDVHAAGDVPTGSDLHPSDEKQPGNDGMQ